MSSDLDSACGLQRVPFVELLRALTLDQEIAVVESLEINFDHVSTGVIDPHEVSLWATFKESLSHDSENRGNCYCPVSTYPPDGLSGSLEETYWADVQPHMLRKCPGCRVSR